MRADRRADSRKKHLAGLLAAVLAAGMLFVVPARADAPKKDGTSYEGYGKVEVEFEARVDWKSPKVTVKNSAGKTCKVRILEREDDEITFRIVKFVQGERYKFTISGVRKAGTSGYGKVTGSVKVPRTKTSEKKAVKTAIADAVRMYKIRESTVKGRDVDIEKYKGKKVFEVEFKAKKGSRWHSYEYLIDRTSGKILDRDVD